MVCIRKVTDESFFNGPCILKCRIMEKISILRRRTVFVIVFLIFMQSLLIYWYYIETTTGQISSCDLPFMNYSYSMVDQWLPVDDERSAYIFSAYLTTEDEYKWVQLVRTYIYAYIMGWELPEAQRTVTLIGAKSYGKTDKQLFCYLWYQPSNGRNITMVPVTATPLPEGATLRYRTTFFTCQLPGNKAPIAVSVVTVRCQVPNNMLVVRNNTLSQRFNFTMCLAPLFKLDQHKQAQRLIEWVELNRLLGADYFVVYNYSITTDVDRVLRMYMRDNIMEVVQWPLPMNGFLEEAKLGVPEIHYFGQHAALNDCLYRMKFRSKYIINTDMDEFIIPHHSGVVSWSDMMRYIPKKSNIIYFTTSVFVITFHSTNVTDDSQNIEPYEILVLSNSHRDSNFLRERSKYIVKTDVARKILIHSVLSSVAGVETTVPASLGFIHHYRQYAVQNVSDKIEDRTVNEIFETDLTNNVYKTYEKLRKIV